MNRSHTPQKSKVNKFLESEFSAPNKTPYDSQESDEEEQEEQKNQAELPSSDKVELIIGMLESEKNEMEERVQDLEQQMFKRNLKLKKERHFCLNLANEAKKVFAEEAEVKPEQIKHLKKLGGEVQELLKRFSFRFLLPQLVSKNIVEEKAEEEEKVSLAQVVVEEQQKKQNEADDQALQKMYEQQQDKVIRRLLEENRRLKASIKSLTEPNSQEQRVRRKLERNFNSLNLINKNMLNTQMNLTKDFKLFRWYDQSKKHK